jgi:hypothetical protein
MAQTLGEVVAVEKSARQFGDKRRDELLKMVQQPRLFAGWVQVYRHDDEDPEQQRLNQQPVKGEPLQLRAEEVLAELAEVLTRPLDLTAAKDRANTEATADVVLSGDDEPLLREVPVTYLLWLEKQLDALKGFIRALPVRDSTEAWVWDPDEGNWRSRDPEQRLRVEKGLKSLVLIEPTQYQPGQAQAVPDEKRTGMYEITKFSGALSRERKNQLTERVELLSGAVRQARERANRTVAEPGASAGSPLFSYLFA